MISVQQQALSVVVVYRCMNMVSGIYVKILESERLRLYASRSKAVKVVSRYHSKVIESAISWSHALNGQHVVSSKDHLRR
jgi:hypothetical protein